MRLFICALLHAQASAVLEIARPRQTQPKAIRIAPPESPTTDSRGGAVAAWHAERKNAITRKLGADVVARLEAPTPGRTLGCLIAADTILIGLATATPHLVAETIWQVPPLPTAAIFVSNHGVDDEGYGVGGAARDRPTHSVYGSTWFDVLCLAANYHCEHHDFPKVPLWKLPELKRLAGAGFYPASPSWRAVLRGAFSSKITYPRWERV